MPIDRKRPLYKIKMAIESVVEDLQHGDDRSATTIRCAINDRLDTASKDGWRVRFDYDQSLAVARVKKILSVLDNYATKC